MLGTGDATLRWVPVCRFEDLVPGEGVAALVSGAQVAVFRTLAGDVLGVSNRDPAARGRPVARGVLGERAGVPVVTGPSSHSYDLRSGRCLDGSGLSLAVYPVRVRDGVVEVGRRLKAG